MCGFSSVIPLNMFFGYSNSQTFPSMFAFTLIAVSVSSFIMSASTVLLCGVRIGDTCKCELWRVLCAWGFGKRACQGKTSTFGLYPRPFNSAMHRAAMVRRVSGSLLLMRISRSGSSEITISKLVRSTASKPTVLSLVCVSMLFTLFLNRKKGELWLIAFVGVCRAYGFLQREAYDAAEPEERCDGILDVVLDEAGYGCACCSESQEKGADA